jgi:hypothetical protein
MTKLGPVGFDSQPTEYLIWSEEHWAWWRPARRGYTTSMRQAGRYPKDEAEAICSSANFGLNFNEVPVPITPAIRTALELKGSGR